MMKLKIPHKKKAMNENTISKLKRSLRSKHKREKSKKTTAIKKERPKKKRKDRTARSVNTAKRFRLLTFSRKMLLLCLAPMMLICILITVFSRQSLTKSVENEIEGALKIVAISLVKLTVISIRAIMNRINPARSKRVMLVSQVILI